MVKEDCLEGEESMCEEKVRRGCVGAGQKQLTQQTECGGGRGWQQGRGEC